MTVDTATAIVNTSKEAIGAAIGRIPSGVFIVTARHAGKNVGMMASWISQASFEPPSIVVAVHPDRAINAAIEATGTFSVNVVGADNKTLMKAFGRPSENSFDEIGFTLSEQGIHLNDAIAVLHCKVTQTVDAGDHKLIVAEVLSAGGDFEAMPTLAPLVHIRKSGFHY